MRLGEQQPLPRSGSPKDKAPGNDRDHGAADSLHHRRLACASFGNTAYHSAYPSPEVTAPHTTPSAIPVVCRRFWLPKQAARANQPGAHHKVTRATCQRVGWRPCPMDRVAPT